MKQLSYLVALSTFWLVLGPALADEAELTITEKLVNYMSNKQSSEHSLNLLLMSGGMDGFFTTDEIESIFDHLTEKYPSVVQKQTIGQSFQGRDLQAYRLVSSKDPSARKSKVFFTGLHHARELITANMIIKIFIETLHSLVHSTNRFTFWNFCDLIIVPVVNIDSHKLISDAYGSDRFESIRDKRKSMNSNFCPDGSIQEQGVDLNRNYGFHYGEEVDDNDECGETFRGRNAFSEPETRAIRDFLQREQGVVSAMNFHSYGNMWIHPFNYLKVAHRFPDNVEKQIVNFYEDFGKSVAKVSESKYGNAIEMVGYSTDGEASDWMLGELGIVSFSPELGSLNPDAQDFMIAKNLIVPVLEENFRVVEMFLERNSFKMDGLSYGFDNNGVFAITFENKGLATIFDPVLSIPKTAKSLPFLQAISRVEVEIRPSEYVAVKFEGNEEKFAVVWDKINRLEQFRVLFHMNDAHIQKKTFALKVDLKIQAGYQFQSFNVKHSGIFAKKQYILLLYGAGIGMAIVFAGKAFLALVRWFRKEKREIAVENAEKELNC